MSEQAKGLWAMIGACVIWGLSPIYFDALAEVPALDVLSHRVIWSLVFFLAVLVLQRRGAALWRALRGRAGLWIGCGAVVAAVNWLAFIWAVQTGRTVEASLGYYTYPLLAVLLGYFIFGERLTRVQILAVALAGLAVAVLALGLGRGPWAALAVSLSFGFYGVVKKKLSVSPVVSVTAEVLLLTPLAVLWLVGSYSGWWPGAGAGGPFGGDPVTALLLVAVGPLTGGPLMLFSYAVQRVRMATAGLVQYLSPTLQFACAVLVLGEKLTPWHMLAFPMIWGALALYSVVSLRQPKVAVSAVSSAAASGTVAR